MTKRAEYIRENYTLTFDGEWVATNYFRGSVFAEIRGADRADVCRKARCRWGHFNFADEARAFDKIFGRTSL